MFDIGLFEIFLISIIALLVLGPERLPHAARSAGLAIGKIRRVMSGLQSELEKQAHVDEIKKHMQDPVGAFDDDKKQPTDAQLSTASKPNDTSNT